MIAKKKRKRDDKEAERAATATATVERVERGGRASSIHIGDQLIPAQRAIVEEFATWHGSPRGTIMLGGQRVSLEDTQEGTRVQEIEPQEEIE